jgi:hypothetical protein
MPLGKLRKDTKQVDKHIEDLRHGKNKEENFIKTISHFIPFFITNMKSLKDFCLTLHKLFELFTI